MRLSFTRTPPALPTMPSDKPAPAFGFTPILPMWNNPEPVPATLDPATGLVRIEVGIGLMRVVQHITHEAFTFRVINWPGYYGPLTVQEA